MHSRFAARACRLTATADGVTTESEYDALGHLVAASRGGVELFRNTVDPDGRVTRTDYPDGTYETVVYDAMRRPVEVTDRSGRITTLAYSIGSTVTNTTVSYIGIDGMEHAHSESVRHDTQLNTREVRNAGRVAVEAYVLDAQDRVVAVTNAEGQVARMEYELGSRVSRMQRFDGSEVGYSWDAFGMKEAAYPSFTNTYERLMDGSLLSATGPNGTVGYAYDKFGNVTNAVSGQGSVVSSYDNAGYATRRSFGAGYVDYAYDTAGRLTGMTWNVGGVSMPFSYEYSPVNGALAAVEYPNGVVSERGYDVMDRLSLIGWSGYDSADADTRQYSYDNADNIVSIATADGATIDYAYDGIDRLAGESKSDTNGAPVRSAAYIYDDCGNRMCNSLTEGGVTETYANSFEAGDRLAGWSRADSNIGPDSVTNAVYLYAASGCTTGVVSRLADGTERRVSYTWTDDYRLASVSVDGEPVAEYAYDVLGNLVGVATTDESFEILVDGGHSLADVASDGTPLRVYLRGPGVDNWLGFVDMTGTTPVPYYYVTDHLGSVLAVVDANGNIVERYEYDAWGKVLSVTDADGNALSRSAIGNRILWQGREYSWTTGLYYFRNRWYDPVIGRWISKDPIGIDGGINLYEFCEENPVNADDPWGLCPDYSEGLLGTLDWTIYTLGWGSIVRSWYDKHTWPLDGFKDSPVRSYYKARARAITPVVPEEIIEYKRPHTGPRSGSVGHANRTNPRVDRFARVAGRAAGALAVVSASIEAYGVVTAPEGERGARAARAGGHFLGGALGGEAGAAAGAAIGSVVPGPGTVIGAVIGGVVGSFAGGELGGIGAEALYNWW